MVNDLALEHIKGELARLLSEERVKRRLSMNVLAADAGLSQSFVSSFESAHKNPALGNKAWNPTVDTLLRMAAVLGLNAGEILKQAVQNVEKDEKLLRSGLKAKSSRRIDQR